MVFCSRSLTIVNYKIMAWGLTVFEFKITISTMERSTDIKCSTCRSCGRLVIYCVV